jgi:hypothetical protein
MPETVIVCAPVKAVPPEFNKVQRVPPAAGAAHFRPVVSPLAAVRTKSFVPTANLSAASAPVPTIKSPLASITFGLVFWALSAKSLALVIDYLSGCTIFLIIIFMNCLSL